MKTSNNTILITGGSAGIGFEIAKQLSQLNNQVIIVGRDNERLQKAARKLTNTTAIMADVSNAMDVDRLVKTLRRDYPALNVVINNAGKVFAYKLDEESAGAFDKATDEMMTNYLSVIRLNEFLLPLLRQQQEAAIVNVSSIVSIVPNNGIATYSASKAALHSYTLALRDTLATTSNILVFELQPPLVDTEFSASIGGNKGIPPTQVAEDLVQALKSDRFEIRVGNTEEIYRLYLTSPDAAFRALNPAA